MTLNWDPDVIPEGLNLTLTDNLDGTFIEPMDMGGEPSVIIGHDQTFITGVRITVGVSEAGLEPMGFITRFDLKQNMPNPFGRITSITYDVPRTSVVDIAIYDTAGRKVRVLAAGVQSTGRHTLNWDGFDARGSRVSPGVYFCRMQTEAYTRTRKLLLIR